jgi:uroporphyrin-III C-methyltransferase
MTQHSIAPTFGVVYLVGAGPGDADLITVAGLKVLRRADAVVYDALVNLALLEEAPPEAERIYVGKRAGRHSMRQEEINELLGELAQRHAVVVRLKGGDPFVFGRGGEEMSHLRSVGVSVQIVPGVSSAIAAAAAVGVPVTHRSLSASFAVVTGHNSTESATGPDWKALAAIDTVVIMMGLEKAAEVQRRLLDAGRSPRTPALIVCSATLPEQQSVTTTLGRLHEAAAGLAGAAPATIIVGAVVTLAQGADASGEQFSLEAAGRNRRAPYVCHRSQNNQRRLQRPLRVIQRIG